jgi:ribosome-associated toxin RatA of RatAB toxin-antitoxin module
MLQHDIPGRTSTVRPVSHSAVPGAPFAVRWHPRRPASDGLFSVRLVTWNPQAWIGSMALVEKSVLVQYTPEQMFRLVDQVEDYPAFLPWCGGSSVSDRSAATLRATVQIDYHGVRQSFTTENIRREPESIDVKLVDGPFRQLDGSWRFKALGQQACKIEFRLHYEFTGRILEKLLSPVFNHIANTFVDAFVKRAEQVYGKQ